jgi:hypothetical protein
MTTAVIQWTEHYLKFASLPTAAAYQQDLIDRIGWRQTIVEPQRSLEMLR